MELLDIKDITKKSDKLFTYKRKEILTGYGTFVKFGIKDKSLTQALFKDVVVEGKYFRDHTWVTLSVGNLQQHTLKRNKTYTFICRLIGYLNINNPTGPLKYSIKRLRNIEIKKE